MFCYSHNEEEFYGSFESIEAALAEGFSDTDNTQIWIGECNGTSKASEYLQKGHVECLLESLTEYAFDECGECVEGWLDGPEWPNRFKAGTPEREQADKRTEAHRAEIQTLRDDLGAVIDKWADDHGKQPNFYKVNNVKPWTVAEYEALQAEPV